MYLLALTLLLPMATGQYYGGVRPDVRFDDKSDRFDVSPIMGMDQFEEQDYRRRILKKEVDKDDNTRDILRLMEGNLAITESAESADDKDVAPRLAELIKAVARRTNGVQGGWAWHDDMQSDGNMNVYEDNLNQFLVRPNQPRRSLVDYLHHGQAGWRPASRRSAADSDAEVLIHHAVPITMNVKGFLRVPEVKAE